MPFNARKRMYIYCLSLTLRMLLKRPLIDLLHKTYGDMQTACMCKYLGILNTVLCLKIRTQININTYVWASCCPILVGGVNSEVSLVILVNANDSQRWTSDVSTFKSTLRLHVNRFIYIRTYVTFLPEQISYIIEGCDVHI